MKRKKLMIGSALLLAVLMVVGGTMAWFTATADPVENKFKAGTVELDLKEFFYKCGADNVNPGDCFYKNVYVKNTGTKRSKIRIKVDNKFEGNLPVAGVVKYEINSRYWSKGNDGYYYYRYILPKGQYTHRLFKYDRVCFDGPAMNNDYQGKEFTMTIGAEAVQASHNAPWPTAGQNVEEAVEELGLQAAPENSQEMMQFMQENPEGILEVNPIVEE